MKPPLRLLVPLAATAALALPSIATARAVIRLAPACYQSGETGFLTGSGFKPKASWTAKLSGTRTLGTGHTDAHGRIRARFIAPRYHGTNGTRSLTLSVTDGPNVASTRFTMTPLSATFTPRTGNPATLRVRWRALGLTSGHGVYVHYLTPDGGFRTTLRIGTAHGACGTLKTGLIALFPFVYTYGLWTLQVDASAHFSRATLPRVLIPFQIRKP
jgi:hypothetical protein